MNPVVIITSIGVFIACCIIIWAAFEVYRRVGRGRKRDAGVMHRWVPLQVVDSAEEDDFAAEQEEPEHDPGFDVHSKVQQNGHYTESKHKQL